VLLVEDVVTTGLSSREAMEAVRRAGRRAGRGRLRWSTGSGGTGRSRRAVLPADQARSARLTPRRASARTCRSAAEEAGEPQGSDDKLRLGVNIDHVATIRNARAGSIRIRCGRLARGGAGADGITAHLREDRRHIRDDDIARLKAELPVPLNLEMAATEEMLEIALRHLPHAVCIVPERREERTTEGGARRVRPAQQARADRRAAAGRRHPRQPVHRARPGPVEAALRLRAPVVEFHTGRYAHREGEPRAEELKRIADAAALAVKNGIEPHAGHGLTYENVAAVAAIPQLMELNIGHFLIGDAIFTGLAEAVGEMRRCMDEARGTPSPDRATRVE
jgi:pyridoxine 5-phosphate synthase